MPEAPGEKEVSPLRKIRRLSVILLLLALLLSGCGSPEPSGSGTQLRQISSAVSEREDFTPYAAPPLATVAFHPELAEGNDEVKLDLSSAAEGYVAVSARSDKRLKFQVLMGEWTYTYNIASDGSPSFFPLQCGNGEYTFRVMENISASKSVQIYRAVHEIVLLDEFQPFLRPSDYSKYDADSACVKKAAELASACSNRLEVVSAVYAFVCRQIRYDAKKAETVQSGYLPDVDETLRSGKGICFDYAALAAAMLRSQGIPTKIIFGYVAPNNLYHAWNMFYTEESGWVTVSFEVDDRSWNRIDLTFSAGGAGEEFTGDGSNYTDVYSY